MFIAINNSWIFEEAYLSSIPSLKLREPKMDKRVPKFLIEEDIIHLRILCQTLRERGLVLSVDVHRITRFNQ